MEIYPTTLFVIIAVLIILVLLLGYAAFNLLIKNEKLEDANNESFVWVSSVGQSLILILNKIKELDNQKMFESDDEVGTTFNMIKDEINKIEKLFKEQNDG